MNYLFWILVGIIIGWVIEWVIDWLFWRKPVGVSPEKLAAAEAENRRLQAQLAESQQRLAQLEAENSQRPSLGERSMPSRSAHMPDLDATITQMKPVKKDRLEEIEGIGPVYAKRLNDAGIFSFAQLAEQSADRVREIINPEEWQKIEPESWIAQAVILANPDHLEDINGIGDEYAQRLNQAGIYTFAQLVEAGPEQLRQIIDPEHWQKIEPEKWIAEARQFAAQKSDRATTGA
ncbi:MAG: DUF4332 domain-containing protein [Anaerolineales bacterium]|nr:DUF4332 domain-containing protein [Anaerolineales bacterium]